MAIKSLADVVGAGNGDCGDSGDCTRCGDLAGDLTGDFAGDLAKDLALAQRGAIAAGIAGDLALPHRRSSAKLSAAVNACSTVNDLLPLAPLNRAGDGATTRRDLGDASTDTCIGTLLADDEVRRLLG